MCSLRCLGAFSVMGIFSNKNVVIIVVLHRILIELPGILKFIEAIFSTHFGKPFSEHFCQSANNSTAV